MKLLLHIREAGHVSVARLLLIPVLAACQGHSQTTIRVLFGYTDLAEATMAGWGMNIYTEIDNLVANMNTIYANSQTGIVFQTAAKYNVNYVESAVRPEVCPGDRCGYTAFTNA